MALLMAALSWPQLERRAWRDMGMRLQYCMELRQRYGNETTVCMGMGLQYAWEWDYSMHGNGTTVCMGMGLQYAWEWDYSRGMGMKQEWMQLQYLTSMVYGV